MLTFVARVGEPSQFVVLLTGWLYCTGCTPWLRPQTSPRFARFS